MSDSIRVRVCLAVVEDDKLLLVPHYRTDGGAVQWVVPGGRIEFGDGLQEAAAREFHEETGLQAEVTGLLRVSETILPDRPYHSITISLSGKATGGALKPEADHPYGEKMPRWWSTAEVSHFLRSRVCNPISPVASTWFAEQGGFRCTSWGINCSSTTVPRAQQRVDDTPGACAAVAAQSNRGVRHLLDGRVDVHRVVVT